MSPLIPYQPDPDALYSLEWVTSFSGIPRRQIVLYARHGLIRPALDPTQGWYFSVQTLHTLQRIRSLELTHRFDLRGMKLVLELLHEIERLRAEMESSAW